jgi:predicted transcriptional regulator
MANRVNTLSIYIPKSKLAQSPVERLSKLSETKECSVNHLIVEAILQYLDREERKK